MRYTFSVVLIFLCGVGSIIFVEHPLRAQSQQSGQSAHPFKRDASGTLSRTLFSGTGPVDTTVAIREVIMKPRAAREVSALPGPALLEWIDGRGTFSVGGGSPKALGSDFQVIPAGKAVKINNQGVSPIRFRLYIFAGK
jgi:hypothetical protein